MTKEAQKLIEMSKSAKHLKNYSLVQLFYSTFLANFTFFNNSVEFLSKNALAFKTEFIDKYLSVLNVVLALFDDNLDFLLTKFDEGVKYTSNLVAKFKPILAQYAEAGLKPVNSVLAKYSKYEPEHAEQSELAKFSAILAHFYSSLKIVPNHIKSTYSSEAEKHDKNTLKSVGSTAKILKNELLSATTTSVSTATADATATSTSSGTAAAHPVPVAH